MTTPSSSDASPEDLDVDILVRDAVRAFATQKFEKCRALLKAAAQKDPRSLDVALWSARLAQKSADWEGLETASEKWLALDPESMEARQSLAHALGQLNRWAAAAAMWTEIAVGRPDDIEALVQAVRFNRAAGRLPQAKECVRGTLTVLGDDDELKIELARSLAQSLDLNCAKELFSDFATRAPARAGMLLQEFLDREDTVGAAVLASSLGPLQSGYRHEILALADTLVHEAVQHEGEGAFDQAFWKYSALLLIEPADEIAGRGRGRALATQGKLIRSAIEGGDFDRAAEAAYNLLRCDPEHAPALLAAGDVAVVRQEQSEARLLWATILDHKISVPGNLRAATQYFEEVGDYGLAHALYRKMASAGPPRLPEQDPAERFCRRLVQLGRSMLASDRLIEAGRALSAVPSSSIHFDDSARANGQVCRSLLKRLRNLYRSDDPRSVVDQGLEALTLYPEDVDINRMVARAASKLRNHELAQRHWSALESHPDAADEVLLGLARSCYGLKRWAECNRSALALLQSDPEHAEARKLLETSGRQLGSDAG